MILSAEYGMEFERTHPENVKEKGLFQNNAVERRPFL